MINKATEIADLRAKAKAHRERVADPKIIAGERAAFVRLAEALERRADELERADSDKTE